MSLVRRKRPVIFFRATGYAAAALIIIFLARATAAFLAQRRHSKYRNSFKTSTVVGPRKNGGQQMVASVTDESLPHDDPWIVLEDIKAWASLNRDAYDLINVQNAINTLRDDCQLNINTLEKEIDSIQQMMQREHQQTQYASSDGSCSSRQGVDDFDDQIHCADDALIPIPTLKAIFVGYRSTEDDRTRLTSAHPEEN